MILILCDSVISYISLKFERIALQIPSFLENKYMECITQKDWKHTHQPATNEPFSKKRANTECAPRAAPRGTALLAVDVLTSHHILPEPLHEGLSVSVC